MCYWDSRVSLVVKNSPANAGDTRNAGPILGLGKDMWDNVQNQGR